jgi:ribonucleoside-diphosphate reductase alpha chain
MMGVLRVDHPDIMRFINAKADQTTLTNFNISVAVSNAFMEALATNSTYDLVFEGRTYSKIHAVDVWARIMERNWDWAEPGILFIDRINEMNPLNYCEHIAATNPCGEQPLPPNGACLLGSLNIPKYISGDDIDYDLLKLDVAVTCRAFDNVIDVTRYPMERQREEQQNKRRMGIGVTGMANALEIIGNRYASKSYLKEQGKILACIRDTAYKTSINAATKLGPFPLFNAKKWLESGFAKTLPDSLRSQIKKKGLRNGLLLSIAPTGTISLCADNVSSGIEPPYSLEQERLIYMPDGQVSVSLVDYAYAKYGVKGKTASSVPASDHIKVLCSAQKYMDSAVSKTCNVNGAVRGESTRGTVSFNGFKKLYLQAYKGGAKGCTTFNKNGKRFGIIKEKLSEETEGGCVIDPETGAKTCEI